MLVSQPGKNDPAELLRFGQELTRFGFGNVARSVVVGDIALAAALIEVVGELSILRTQLRQDVEGCPVMSGLRRPQL